MFSSGNIQSVQKDLNMYTKHNSSVIISMSFGHVIFSLLLLTGFVLFFVLIILS